MASFNYNKETDETDAHKTSSASGCGKGCGCSDPLNCPPVNCNL